MVSSRVSPAGEQGHARRKFQTEDSAIEAKVEGGKGRGGQKDTGRGGTQLEVRPRG